MTLVSTFVPMINLAPPHGYRLYQSLPLREIGRRIVGGRADIRITRRVFRDQECLREDVKDVEYVGGEYAEDPALLFELEMPISDAQYRDDISGYVLTTVESRGKPVFAQSLPPGFYTAYRGPGFKSFISDGALQFASPQTIRQIAAVGKWADGYPVAELDRNRGQDHSAILINPYAKEASVWLEVSGHDSIKPRFRVPPFSTLRISMSEILGCECRHWRGQIFITGPNRLVTYHLCHELGRPNRVIALEHTDSFRGVESFRPATSYLRYFIGEKLKELRSR